MELLLKVLTRRNLVALAALAGLLLAAERFQAYPRRWLGQRLYPPQGHADPGGAEITALNDRRQSLALHRRYQRLVARLDQAESEGFDVSVLRRKAAIALQLDAPGRRRSAATILAETELRLPFRKTMYLPAAADEPEADDIPPDVPGRKVRAVR